MCYYELKSYLSFSNSTTFAEALAYNYYYTLGTDGEYFGTYDTVWLELKIRDYGKSDTYEFTDEHGVGYNIVSKRLDTWTEDIYKGVHSYRFSLRSIYAYAVGNEIQAELHATSNNNIFYTSVDVSSIKDYAFTGLEKSSNEDFKRLLVDMLNYSAAAQVYFGYNSTQLVNASLTDEQKALGTQTDVIPTKTEKTISLANATGQFSGKSVVFANSIELKYYMTFDADVDVSQVTLSLSYTSESNNKLVEVNIPGTDFGYDAKNNEYYAKLTTIYAYDADKVVSATLYADGQAISDTLEYGLEAYSKVALEKSTSENYKALIKNMLKYTRSASQYF